MVGTCCRHLRSSLQFFFHIEALQHGSRAIWQLACAFSLQTLVAYTCRYNEDEGKARKADPWIFLNDDEQEDYQDLKQMESDLNILDQQEQSNREVGALQRMQVCFIILLAVKFLTGCSLLDS